MFDNLSDRLQSTIKRLKGQSRLSEENIQNALREVRMALLEADVALPVVKEFTKRLKEEAIGRAVADKLSPDQAFIKIVQQALIDAMGESNAALNLATQPPAVILLAGLQGSGKTTTAAKLAKRLKNERKKVTVVSCDVYRPAAIHQLQTLAAQIEVDFIPSQADEAPAHIAARALQHAKQHYFDVLIVDTAGRLHIDDELMNEIKQLHHILQPIETLFVVDSMTGQDAANTAKAFDDALPLTGVILSKIDGDARGGAALSVRSITGKPIKFLGVGEKTDALEAFHPDRIASRILGMGDILGLIEDLEQQVDRKQAEKIAKKLTKSKSYTLNDLREQMIQMQSMDFAKILEKIPGMDKIPQHIKDEKLNEKKIKRQIAIINSMTPQERRHPDIIKGSRKRRIAAGSGTQVQEVNTLLKQFQEMQRQMKQMQGSKMSKMMRRMSKGGRGALPF